MVKKKYYNGQINGENYMLPRLKIGLAFRYSRNIVGGITGLIFSLGNIFKAPLKGAGPAAIIGSLGLSVFIFKVRNNFKIEIPNISVADYKTDRIQSSTALIATELMKQPQKFNKFQKDKAALIHPERKDEITVISFSHNQLEAILKSILNDSFEYSEKWENIALMYIHCSAAFLAQVGSHFMECLLAKAYDKPDLFNFNEFTADNILIIMLSALSLYNGYQSFKENHSAFEKANIDDVCEKFFKTYR